MVSRQLADDGFEAFAVERAAAALELVDRRAGRTSRAPLSTLQQRFLAVLGGRQRVTAETPKPA